MFFFLATFSMLGKLSKADGVVSPEELEVVEHLMSENLKLSDEARQFAISVFNAAKNSDSTFNDYARQFYEEFQGNPEVLSSIIDLMLRLAHADGVLHPGEQALIDEAVNIFGVSNEYQQLKARYSSSNDLQQCYGVLGATEEESLVSVKKKYRKLVMTYHPDRLQANGVSPEFAVAAEDRFKEIQHAFEVIEKHLSR